VAPEAVTDDLRRSAKAITSASSTHVGIRLAQQLKIDAALPQYIDLYFARYPG